MKRIIYLNFCFFFVLLNVSCDDFLTVDPKGRISSENFFSTEADLDMATTGMMSKYMKTNYRTAQAFYMYAGDDVTAYNGSNKIGYSDTDCFYPNSGYSRALDTYALLYETIKACNAIIANAEKMNIDRIFIEQRLGQAYFIRGLCYFQLVRLWGSIPLMLENKINYHMKRSDVQTVYNQIESDLLKAEQMLPIKYTVEPYFRNGINIAPNKGAAKVVLASVYMTEAGWPLKKGIEYYDRAAAKYKEVISAEAEYGYILEPDIRTLVKEPNCDYSKEIVFGTFHYVGNSDSYSGPRCELPDQCAGYTDLLVEIQYYLDFPEGARKKAWFLDKVTDINKPKDPVTGLYQQFDWWNTNTNYRHPHWKKNIDNGSWDYNEATGYYSNKGIVGSSSRTRMIIRYADVLLLYSEAVAYGSSSSVNALALDCLHRVQKRAGVDNLTPDNITKSDFQQAVLNERKWETGGMEHSMMGRFFTMQRHEILHLQGSYRHADEFRELNPKLSLSEEFYYFPIPDAELLIVPDLGE